MTARLFLDSLEIHRFRAFEHLRIERLGRVNLIVGRNNVGKTCLLEALQLYAHQEKLEIIWLILEARDEGRRTKPITLNGVENLKYLFYGRQKLTPDLLPIQIGPIDSPQKKMSVSLGWNIDRSELLSVYVHLDNKNYDYKLGGGGIRLQDSELSKCIYVSAGGLLEDEISRLWEKVALTDLEEEVIKALRIIAPQVERVSVVNNRFNTKEWEPIPIVKISGNDDPIPLRSLGEGMNRLLGLSLALANVKDGILLIDEIESGLHYSVQPDIWRLVFEVARRLNVQVFATTHSWDCLTAFQEAAKEDEQDEGVLIRLLERKGKITTVQFDEDELEVVAREGIEVR